MRVLMTADTLGGVFTYAVELIHALEAHGVQTVLATLGRPLSTSQRNRLSRCQALEIYESSYALEWMPEPWADVEASTSWLRELAHRLKPDCIHFNHFARTGPEWEAPTLVVAHSCVWSWWRAVHGTTPGPEWARYYALVKASIHGADRVVAPSEAMLANVVRDYGRPAHAALIPNGVDLAAFTPRPKLPYVIAAGRLWDEAKNVGALERIASELSWPVYLAGESVEPDRLAADGGKRSTACRPLGALDRATLARCLARAGIYVMPARYEPFGLSVLEAAAAGCALVLGHIPSLIENWQGAACFVDPNDPDTLRSTIERLIADANEREHWSARAHQRAERLNAARMAERYVRTYAELTAASLTRSLPCAS